MFSSNLFLLQSSDQLGNLSPTPYPNLINHQSPYHLSIFQIYPFPLSSNAQSKPHNSHLNYLKSLLTSLYTYIFPLLHQSVIISICLKWFPNASKIRLNLFKYLKRPLLSLQPHFLHSAWVFHFLKRTTSLTLEVLHLMHLLPDYLLPWYITSSAFNFDFCAIVKLKNLKLSHK
jgi:hypothetical protein